MVCTEYTADHFSCRTDVKRVWRGRIKRRNSQPRARWFGLIRRPGPALEGST